MIYKSQNWYTLEFYSQIDEESSDSQVGDSFQNQQMNFQNYSSLYQLDINHSDQFLQKINKKLSFGVAEGQGKCQKCEDKIFESQFFQSKNETQIGNKSNFLDKDILNISTQSLPFEKSQQQNQNLGVNCIKSFQIQNKSQKIRKERYNFPKETKNTYKNFTQAMKDFIKFNFDLEILQYKEVELFLKKERFGKVEFSNIILQSPILQQIGKLFFKQFAWSRYFLKNNRVDLEQYFRLNLHFQIEWQSIQKNNKD